MKLVVEYSTGEYDSFYVHNYCVEYESKDHFSAAFINAFDKWIPKQQKYRKLQKDLSDARASKDPRKMTPAWNAWKEFHDSGENKELYYLDVDGYKFALPENDWEVKDDQYKLLSLPEIYTLEEWFEMKQPERV